MKLLEILKDCTPDLNNLTLSTNNIVIKIDITSKGDVSELELLQLEEAFITEIPIIAKQTLEFNKEMMEINKRIFYHLRNIKRVYVTIFKLKYEVIVNFEDKECPVLEGILLDGEVVNLSELDEKAILEMINDGEYEEC